MNEEEDEYDEENDTVPGLEQIHDGVGAMNLNKSGGIPPSAPKTMSGMKSGINPN